MTLISVGLVAVAVTCRLSFGKARSLYQQQGRKHGRGVTVRLMNKIIESVGRSTDLVKQSYMVAQ